MPKRKPRSKKAGDRGYAYGRYWVTGSRLSERLRPAGFYGTDDWLVLEAWVGSAYFFAVCAQPDPTGLAHWYAAQALKREIREFENLGGVSDGLTAKQKGKK